MTNLKVSLQDEKQRKQLLEIFTGLGHKTDELDDQYKGEQWIDIGFQGLDPSTDFRGTGDLGLQNLHYFVTKNNKIANQILQESKEQGQFYFFACCGINITFHIFENFQNNINFFGFEKEENFDDVIERFNRTYVKIFQDFHKKWLQYEQKSNVMQFNIFLKDYFKKIDTFN